MYTRFDSKNNTKNLKALCKQYKTKDSSIRFYTIGRWKNITKALPPIYKTERLLENLDFYPDDLNEPCYDIDIELSIADVF